MKQMEHNYVSDVGGNFALKFLLPLHTYAFHIYNFLIFPETIYLYVCLCSL